MNKIVILFILLALSSCASKLVLTPRKCPNKAIWVNDKKLKTFGEKKYWIVGSEKKVFIRDILKENGITCSQIRGMSLTVKREWSDSLLSILPFVARRTLVLKGYKKSDFMDDSEAKDGL
jgi:hypothetical protein